MAEVAVALRVPTSNAIETTIARRVGEARNAGLEAEYRERICRELSISGKHFTQMLNNNSWPTVKQLAVIAQVLEVVMEELLNYGEAGQ